MEIRNPINVFAIETDNTSGQARGEIFIKGSDNSARIRVTKTQATAWYTTMGSLDAITAEDPSDPPTEAPNTAPIGLTMTATNMGFDNTDDGYMTAVLVVSASNTLTVYMRSKVRADFLNALDLIQGITEV